jgi:pimeloyl-ACP methyl ester carboxylesterase
MKVQRLKRRDPEQAIDVFCRWATSYNDGPGSAWDSLDSERRAALTSGHAAVFADMQAGDGTKQLPRAGLRDLEGVTIAIGSRSDAWFAKTSNALAKTIRTAQVVTIDGAGHAAALDQPARVAATVRTA